MLGFCIPFHFSPRNRKLLHSVLCRANSVVLEMKTSVTFRRLGGDGDLSQRLGVESKRLVTRVASVGVTYR